MVRVKRLFALFAALVMMTSMAACGNTKQNNNAVKMLMTHL